ncbi:penicillin acylase family protein [Marinobacter sp. SS21]|uniref:penicillin acylase family protein n=1 Tax=Marinobacter sp. SS21 TaxID=2979460 RepID=UPI00232E7ACE|nr:penicillin acylase family protein [Marinobacter sp. SS21]MDC0661280.1 penicillin acylase family protein [Marinobacter sp. SS21]
MINPMRLVPGALSVFLLAGCFGGGGGDGSDDVAASPVVRGDQAVDQAPYRASVRRTEFGIPHIEADSFADMGYAYGYLQAEDNLCLLAEDTLTLRGLRARYLGQSGNYTIPANGTDTSNLNADFFWRSVATDAAIAPFKAASDPEVLAASTGFVAGYNRYLAEIRQGEHPGRHQSCRNADWLLPLEEDDMYRRYFRLAVLASSSVFVDGIATAAPPALPGAEALAADTILTQLSELEGGNGDLPFPFGDELPIGSNMYGISGEASRSGESLLFGNPHFPWQKTERLYLAHLKVGADTEIMGAALYGLPAVLIGFNEHFAWSHTVSTAYRFTFYELTLNPADPTQYLFEGEFVDMEQRELTVEFLNEDGSIGEETRTLYRSHYGPMLNFEVSGVPVLQWSGAKAYTLRDANAENDRLLNQFFRWNQAQSYEEFVDLHASVLGVPWVNTVATGPGKPVYYGDVTVVPNVPDSKVTACPTALTPVFAQLAPGLPVLDGARAECAWDTDADAPAPGILGPGNLPTLERTDWVHNCNDSYWLTHPDQPLTGYPSIVGDEQTARTLRTRKCIQQVEQRLDGSDGLGGSTGFDLGNLQQLVLDSTVLSEQLARQSVLDNYCQLPTALGSSGPVAIAEACTVLAAWDGSHNLDAVGGHIWREFWRRIDALPVASPGKWLTPFDPADPVHTPANLNLADPLVEAAFADGVQALVDAGIDLAASTAELQQSGVHQSPIPVFGGESFEGAFTIASSRASDLANGYQVTFGNSYIQTVTWDETGNPLAEGFVTYSQSTDPASPYHQDMTEAYSGKHWIHFPYTEAQIRNDPALVNYRLLETR